MTPTSETPNWRDQASCKGADPEVFFDTHDTRAARGICLMCAARLACLQDALTNHSEYGVFGGLTASERARLHHTLRDRQRLGLATKYPARSA